MSQWAKIAVAMFLLGGCFSEPSLPSCRQDTPCPDTLPVCQEGLCYHHSINYVVPLCDGESVTSGCCNLESGDGCQIAEQAVETVAATMTPEWVAALDKQGTVHWFDRELMPVGTSLVDGAEAPLMVVGDVSGVCLRHANGIACATGPKAEFTNVLEVNEAIGRGAVCPDGFAALATTDAIHVPAGNPDEILPVPIGDLPSEQGPVVHRPTGVLAVPINGGTAVRLLVPYGMHYDLTTMRDIDVPETELPGGVLGLALSEKELYIAAREVLVVMRLDALPEVEAPAWTVKAEDVLWVAGPVVAATGDVLVMDENFDLLRLNHADASGPGKWTGVGPLEGLHAILGGGICGLETGGTTALTALAPSSYFPGLDAHDTNTWVSYDLPDCAAPHSLTLGGYDGRALVACKGSLRILVAPAPTGSKSLWPTVRGPGGSGCFTGDG